MRASRRIFLTEDSQVGEVRRCVIELCRAFGGDETFVGRAAVVATEMARNVVMHGGGGEFVLRESSDESGTGLDVLAIDRGRGIRNIPEAMRDGFSTGGTAGTGLGAVKRMADNFDIYTLPDRGTVVWAKLCIQSSKAEGQFCYGGVNVALERESVSGDAWDVLAASGDLKLIVADGLGHGPFASEASREAIETFRQHRSTSPGQTLEMTHQALTKTRGAAAAIVDVQPSRSRINTAGIGNISMRYIDRASGQSKSFICENGTLGVNIRRVQEFTYPIAQNWLLIMHTDGLGSQWDTGTYPGLTNRQPELIAGVLYRDFKRERDDVTVVVARNRE